MLPRCGLDTNHKPAYVSQVESWKIDMKIPDKDLTDNLQDVIDWGKRIEVGADCQNWNFFLIH
jgi:hypothetical protein